MFNNISETLIYQCLLNSPQEELLVPINSKEQQEIDNFLQASGREKLAELRPAAVLLPLVKDNNNWHMLLTKRASHLTHHAGEISFPGGRYETDDQSLEHTALRETHEEIGIAPAQVKVLGRLTIQNTISQYQVTPFIGSIDSEYQLKIDKNEVEEVFSVPLDYLVNPNNHITVERKFNRQSFSYYEINYKQYNIWGATARIIVNLSKRLYTLSK